VVLEQKQIKRFIDRDDIKAITKRINGGFDFSYYRQEPLTKWKNNGTNQSIYLWKELSAEISRLSIA
jgi:hypothetical protein